jgi:hypothetical protein
MANKLYEEWSVQAIADAIRAKNGSDMTYRIGDMAAAVRAIRGTKTVVWHQCPEVVRNYLANVTYDPSDYSTSQIANYAPATAVVSNTKPIGKTVDGTTYYNEVPNKLTPFARESVAGTLKPLDALRWLNTPQAANVRDLGGWACDGGTVRYGLLIRGGEVTSVDREVLVGECGVRHDLNLRGAEEANRTESPLGSDVWFYCPTNFVWYSLADKATWKEILNYVIEAVTHNEPVYFHCASGADRTATVACLLEAILGVNQSDIDKDYELTCFATGTGTDAEARRRNETDWQNLISQIEQYPGDTFRDKAVSFATSCGIPATKLDAFRSAMSTGTPVPLPGDTDIELYRTDGISLNKKFSGTSIVDGSGNYITAQVPVNMKKYRYIKVSGAYMSGYDGFVSTDNPIFYKIAFLKDGAVRAVQYTNNLALSSNAKREPSPETSFVNREVPQDFTKTWNIDLSKYANYQECDALRLQFIVSTSATPITMASVVPADMLHATCSTKL